MNDQPLSLKIIPSTFCNFRCPFCFLSKKDLSNETFVRFKDNKQLIEDIISKFTIDAFIFHGGELLLFPEILEYLDGVINYPALCNTLVINTNLSVFPDFMKQYDKKRNVKLSVSYYSWNKKFKENVLKAKLAGYKLELHYLVNLIDLDDSSDISKFCRDMFDEFQKLEMYGKTPENNLDLICKTYQHPREYTQLEGAIIRDKFYLMEEYHKYLGVEFFTDNVERYPGV